VSRPLESLCSFEVKNKDFTGFASGGVKGLWYSEAKITDERLVLVESAIDAMSFHVLFGDQHTRYMGSAHETDIRNWSATCIVRRTA